MAGLTVVAAPAPAQAAAATGTGGQFVAQPQRIFDSRSTEYGNAIRKVSKDRWTGIRVAGQSGLPAKIGAVQVTFTAVNPSEAGVIYADRTGVATPNTSMPYLSFYNSQTSNTGVLPVGTDGAIQVSSNIASVDLLVDVQGYYTDGAPVAGGYVPLDKGTRIYASGTKKYAAGQTLNVKVGGGNGVPADASAAVVSIVTSQPGTDTGHLQVYPTGSPIKSDWSLNWNSSQATEWTTNVKLGTNGQITLDFAVGGPVVVSVGIQGYFTAAPGGAGFTPAHTRMYDSRSVAGKHVPIPAGATRTVQMSGVNGIPAFGSGINAVAVNANIISGNGTGHLKMWADDTTEPTEEVQQFYDNRITYGYTAVRVGAGGGVIVKNSSSTTIDVILDIEG